MSILGRDPWTGEENTWGEWFAWLFTMLLLLGIPLALWAWDLRSQGKF